CVIDGKELPGLLDTAQTMRPAVGELQAGAGNEIPHCPRGENFAATRHRSDPCADVNRETAQLLSDPLTFSRVHSGSNLETELTHRAHDRARETHGHSRSLEAGEEPVACGVELATVEPRQQIADTRIVFLEQPVPTAVSELAGALRRADDVREENRRKETFLRLRGSHARQELLQ